MISTGKFREDHSYSYDNNDILVYNSPEERYTDLALGFGIGGKFVSRQGFFLDLSTSIGRNLLSSDSPTIIGQFSLNLGFRF